MSNPGSSVRFKNHFKRLPVPFVIYAYLEAVLEKVPEPKGKRATIKYQNHVPSGYAYKLVCFYDDALSKPVEV